MSRDLFQCTFESGVELVVNVSGAVQALKEKIGELAEPSRIEFAKQLSEPKPDDPPPGAEDIKKRGGW